MYSLLGMEKQTGSPSLLGGRWYALQQMLSRNLDDTISYYRTKTRYIEAGHVLERLLIANPISYQLPLRQFINGAESVAIRLAQSARINTYIQTGLSETSRMYSDDITEFYFACNLGQDLFKPTVSWKDMESVKILHHPCTDMGLYPLVGERTSVEDGYAVIAIDIPVLFYQYRRYLEDSAGLGISGTRSDFIFKYPLLNALKSHYDIVILNRMYNRLHKVVNSEPLRKQPFMFSDWSNRLDQFQDEHIRLIRERSYDIDSVMFNIPLITATNMQAIVKLPSVPATRQILWLLVISRIKMLRLVLELSSEKALMRDTAELATIKRKIIMYRNDNSFKSFLPAYIYQNLEMDFDALLKIVDN